LISARSTLPLPAWLLAHGESRIVVESSCFKDLCIRICPEVSSFNSVMEEDEKSIFGGCIEIATHKHGCCVLQRSIDHSIGAQQQHLGAEIAANAFSLSQDAYGNYVVQYILALEMPWVIADVMDHLEGKYASLSMQKYSSNVIETCLKNSGEEGCVRIVRVLVNSSLFGQLLQDPFANYVVQCALKESKGSLHSTLVDAIRPHLPNLRISPFGKRILSRNNLKNYSVSSKLRPRRVNDICCYQILLVFRGRRKDLKSISLRGEELFSYEIW
jgi:hypothetical protein